MTTMNNEDPADPSVHEPRELPEPAAWVRDLASPQPHCVTSLLYRSKSDADAGTWYAPLYTADQMREAVAAERERSHELLQAADHIRAGLEAELAALRAALAELVALKDMKDRLTELHEMGHGTDYGNYHKRLPLAWAAARAAQGDDMNLPPLLTDT